MEVIDIIKQDISNILDKITYDVLKDPLLKELAGQKATKVSLQEQSEVLKDIFNDYLDQSKDSNLESVCFEFYKEINLPFEIIYKSLMTLKTEIYNRSIKANLLDAQNHIFKLEEFVDRLTNLVSKVFIKKEIVKILNINIDRFDNYLLFRSHTKWLQNIIDAVKSDDLSSFPIESDKDCLFSEHLHYPESLMVCMDANLCSVLHDLHKLLHKNANTFYLFYKQKEYYRAYIVLKELIENILKFNKTLTELYFLSYNNLESNFFNLIELLLFQKSKVYLTIIDFKKLKSLNSTYGESSTSKLLDIIDKKLQSLIHKRENDTLLIKALTANYYMLSLDISKSDIENLNHNIYSITNQSYTIDDKEIELKTAVITLALDEFCDKKRDELIKLMLHLKKDCSKEAKSCYIFKNETIKSLKEWLEKEYKNIGFISSKLEKGLVDVVFQPLYDVKTKKTNTLEALARIVDKDKLIPAGVFIDTIYETDKIELLDRLVLEKLIEKKDMIKKVADTLFVNVSYKSLFYNEYKNILEKFLLEFKDFNIIFELTEQNLVESIDNIMQLHLKYNIHFAVDDFGTGYSSLKTVSDLTDNGTLKVLKMDGEIIRSIDTKKSTLKIMQVISTLCKELELSSVAEFVESKELLVHLENMGITYAQGYYLSKPLTIDELIVKKLNDELDFKV